MTSLSRHDATALAVSHDWAYVDGALTARFDVASMTEAGALVALVSKVATKECGDILELWVRPHSVEVALSDEGSVGEAETALLTALSRALALRGWEPVGARRR
jgi:hypothetical protein